jgi:hypothetical protein
MVRKWNDSTTTTPSAVKGEVVNSDNNDCCKVVVVVVVVDVVMNNTIIFVTIGATNTITITIQKRNTGSIRRCLGCDITNDIVLPLSSPLNETTVLPYYLLYTHRIVLSLCFSNTNSLISIL